MPQPQTLMVNKGTHPTLGTFYHILLKPVEDGVTRLLAVTGDTGLLHKIDQAGQIVSEFVDIPLIREVSGIITALDNAASQQTAPGPLLPA